MQLVSPSSDGSKLSVRWRARARVKHCCCITIHRMNGRLQHPRGDQCRDGTDATPGKTVASKAWVLSVDPACPSHPHAFLLLSPNTQLKWDSNHLLSLVSSVSSTSTINHSAPSLSICPTPRNETKFSVTLCVWLMSLPKGMCACHMCVHVFSHMWKADVNFRCCSYLPWFLFVSVWDKVSPWHGTWQVEWVGHPGNPGSLLCPFSNTGII